jgi:hypothetical protein
LSAHVQREGWPALGLLLAEPLACRRGVVLEAPLLELPPQHTLGVMVLACRGVQYPAKDS